MKTQRMNKMVALLCAACCVVAALSATGLADRIVAPVPAFVLQAKLEPVIDGPDSERYLVTHWPDFAEPEGKVSFVAFEDKVNCKFEAFITGVKPYNTFVMVLRRDLAAQPLHWAKATQGGTAVVQLNTLWGDQVPMCEAGDMVEVWVRTTNPHQPTYIPIMKGELH